MVGARGEASEATGENGDELDNSATSCFTVTNLPAGANIYVGATEQVMTAPFNLESLGICQ